VTATGRVSLPGPVQAVVTRLTPALLIAVVVLAGTVVAGQLTGSTSRPSGVPRPVTVPVTQTTLVCPNLSGSASTASTAVVADVSAALRPPSRSSGTVTTTLLRGSKSRTTTVHPAPGVVVVGSSSTDGTLAVSASGSVAATLSVDQVSLTSHGRGRALTGARCEAPSADWWFAGADGRVGYSDQLVIANPTATAADVSVSVWSVKGPLNTPRLAALPIPALSSVVVSVPAVAPDDATLAMHVHATSGAVTAALVDHRLTGLTPGGSDWVPDTAPPARSLVVPGFPTGPGTRSLVLANPGSADATVNLRVVSTTGSFSPSGVNQVVLGAGQTQIVDLTKALGGVTGAVSLASDQPVLAEGLAVTTSGTHPPDLQWQAAANGGLSGPGAFADGVAPAGGHTLVLLTAPAGAATVDLDSLTGVHKTVTVAAGHSTSIDVTAMVGTHSATSGMVITPVGSAPVYVTRSLSFSGVPGALTTSEPVRALPSTIELPVVREDQRAAVG
jgi:hypothetical protein